MMESLCAIPPDYRYKVITMRGHDATLQRCVYDERFHVLRPDADADAWARTEAQAWIDSLCNYISQERLDLYHEWRCRKDAAPGQWVPTEYDDETV